MISYLLLLVSIVVVVWYAKRRFGHKSKPFCREDYFSSDKPFPMHGFPDLVWQERDGSLTIHDLKVRKAARVYQADVIQLSVYRLLVAKETGRKVNKWGVIRVRSEGKKEQLLKTDLVGEDELKRLYSRYCDILDGKKQAERCKNQSFCQHCPYKNNGCVKN